MAEYRAGLTLERAFGCTHDLKRSFFTGRTGDSLARPKRKVIDPPSLAQGAGISDASSSVARQRTVEVAKASRSALASGVDGSVTRGTAEFFSTARGKVMHIRAPGVGVVRLCALKTSRAKDQVEDVIGLGKYAKAKDQGRRFCAECLRRAGIGKDVQEGPSYVTGGVTPVAG